MNQDFSNALSIFKPGIYFPTGERDVNPWAAVSKASNVDPSSFLAPSRQEELEDKIAADTYKSSYGEGIPTLNADWMQRVLATEELARRLQPSALERARQGAQLQAQLTREQLATLSPYLDDAAAKSTARNLGASKAFLATKEQMPGSVQGIMGEKQLQMASAAGAEAQRQLATADQTRAARDFGGIRFAGKYIQVA